MNIKAALYRDEATAVFDNHLESNGGKKWN